VTNCNKTCQNKCVIFSPKIIYGLDFLIKYDEAYAIYKCTSMDSLCFLQRYQEPINCKVIKMMFIERDYMNKVNQ